MDTMHLLFLALLFLAVSGIAYGLMAGGSAGKSGTRRLRQALAPQTGDEAARNAWLEKLADWSRPLAALTLPAEGWEASGLRRRFLNAGLRHRSIPLIYFGAKAALAFLLPAIFMFAQGFMNKPLEGNLALFIALALGAIGYYLPNVLLRLRVASYQRALFEGFPDAMDLIIVCIEAGLGLDAAIARTAEEMQIGSPAIAGELQLVTLELRMGVSRNQALENLSLRTGVDEIAALVAMLRQADRFGTSIAESLRVHARMLRTKRRQRAEEAAGKIPVKLLFPLIFGIFPALMLVLLGPAVISIYRVFIKNFMGA